MRPVRARAAGDDGSAVVEVVVLAVVVLVPLVYLVLMLARVQAGVYAVTQAARESGRAYVTSPTAEGAPGRAWSAADIAFSDQGFQDGGELEVTCSEQPCLTPEGTVTSVATVRVPLPLVPGFARDVIPLEVPISASQVQVVPRYEVRR